MAPAAVRTTSALPPPPLRNGSVRLSLKMERKGPTFTPARHNAARMRTALHRAQTARRGPTAGGRRHGRSDEGEYCVFCLKGRLDGRASVPSALGLHSSATMASSDGNAALCIV
jgi:hypothetical protein